MLILNHICIFITLLILFILKFKNGIKKSKSFQMGLSHFYENKY
jgi:hypothetical protein